RLISMLLGQALMFLILFLLEFLAFLFLLREYLFLLLLVFPILLWIACVWRAWSIRRRKVARVNGSARSRHVVVTTPAIARPVVATRTRLISGTICAAIGWWIIGTARRFGRNDGAV